MAATDYAVISWRKSSFSGGNASNCVEIGVAWRKSSFSAGNASNCVEVGPGSDAILVRDTKNRVGGTLTFAPASWQALTTIAKTHS